MLMYTTLHWQHLSSPLSTTSYCCNTTWLFSQPGREAYVKRVPTIRRDNHTAWPQMNRSTKEFPATSAAVVAYVPSVAVAASALLFVSSAAAEAMPKRSASTSGYF